METTIRTILCAVTVMLAATSCQKSIDLTNSVEEGKGTIDISINGLMGEYTRVDDTKASLVNNVRASWEGGETVYVYDGSQCLGSLAVSLEGGEDRYALLSTDGSTYTVSTPADGTTKLTLVYSPLLTGAPAVSDGAISISLAAQNSTTAPFVVYATLDYTGTTITNAIVPFKFATSVIKVNCTGLKANTAITSATLSNVNTACKLTLSGTAAPDVTGDINGTITRTADEYFAAGKVNAEGEAVFQIAVPALETVTAARILTVAQGSDKIKDKKFTTDSLNPATSVNTVCQLVGPPAGKLLGEFSVSGTKHVYFSKGNLVATIDASGTPTAWSFAANQYDYLGEGGANNTIGLKAGDVDLFGWSTSTNGTSTTDNYGIKTSTTDSDYSGNFYDWGNAYCTSNSIAEGTWCTLSIDEWVYLINKDGNENIRKDKYKYGVTVCGKTNCLVLAPDECLNGFSFDKDKTTYTEGEWTVAEAAGLVCLPATDFRDGSSVSSGSGGSYWSSSASSSGWAYHMYFSGSGIQPSYDSNRMYGYSVRLITESN